MYNRQIDTNITRIKGLNMQGLKTEMDEIRIIFLTKLITLIRFFYRNFKISIASIGNESANFRKYTDP